MSLSGTCFLSILFFQAPDWVCCPSFVHLSLAGWIGACQSPPERGVICSRSCWITPPPPCLWTKPTQLAQPLLPAHMLCPSCLSASLAGSAHTEVSKATRDITGGLCGAEASLSLPATCLLLQSARHFVLLVMPAHAGLKQGGTCNYSNMRSSRGLIHCTGDSTVSKQF